MKLAIIYFLFGILTHPIFGQDLGSEYSELKTYKSIRKAAKSKSDQVILDLRDQNLTSLPDDIGRLQNVVVLNLSGNRLSKFPERFWTLSNLQVLILSNNDLETLPSDVGSLSGLRKLYLSRNHLSTLPRELGELKKLEILDLSFNDLTDKDADFIREALPNCFILVYVKY